MCVGCWLNQEQNIGYEKNKIGGRSYRKLKKEDGVGMTVEVAKEVVVKSRVCSSSTQTKPNLFWLFGDLNSYHKSKIACATRRLQNGQALLYPEIKLEFVLGRDKFRVRARLNIIKF